MMTSRIDPREKPRVVDRVNRAEHALELINRKSKVESQDLIRVLDPVCTLRIARAIPLGFASSVRPSLRQNSTYAALHDGIDDTAGHLLRIRNDNRTETTEPSISKSQPWAWGEDKHVDDLLALGVCSVNKVEQSFWRGPLFRRGTLVGILEEPITYIIVRYQAELLSARHSPVTCIHSVQSSGGGTTLGEKLYKKGTGLGQLQELDYPASIILTLMLLEPIKRCQIDTQNMLPPSIHLSRYSPPEYLVKHRVGHVIVRAASLVFRYREGVLQRHQDFVS